MGRITIFALQECPHCKRAKGALAARNIPFTEINLSSYPEKRSDMLSLTDRLTVPQVFFNDVHVGGADDTLELLIKWDKESHFDNPLGRYQKEIASLPDPADTRLAIPTTPPVVEKPPPPRDQQNSIRLPDGTMTSVLDITETLIEILPSSDLTYNFHLYKDSFKGTDAVTALMIHFRLSSRDEAVQFGRELQGAQLLHHVCDEHEFKDGWFYYRLQCYHQPELLNSYRVWTERVDPNAMSLLKRLKKLLGKVESAVTDDDGLVDYVRAREDENYNVFEEAVCELQGVDMGKMDEKTRLAFGINLYNLMIKFAFMKRGIGTSSLARSAFFSGVKFRIGPDDLSFNDLENGVLRSNAKPPYSFSAPFGASDPRRRLVLRKLDSRIHFSLNCGAKSCPPVKYFSVDSLEEELRVVAQSFCEEDESVTVDEAKNEVKFTMIMNWFRQDFAESKEKLPESVLRFLRGEKKEKLQRMIGSGAPITVKFHPYDWSTNASCFDVYESSKSKANEFTPSAILRFDSCKQIRVV